MKTVTFKEGDFIIVPDTVAEKFTRNDPSAETVYDWETGRLIWRNTYDRESSNSD